MAAQHMGGLNTAMAAETTGGGGGGGRNAFGDPYANIPGVPQGPSGGQGGGRQAPLPEPDFPSLGSGPDPLYSPVPQNPFDVVTNGRNNPPLNYGGAGGAGGGTNAFGDPYANVQGVSQGPAGGGYPIPGGGNPAYSSNGSWVENATGNSNYIPSGQGSGYNDGGGGGGRYTPGMGFPIYRVY